MNATDVADTPVLRSVALIGAVGVLIAVVSVLVSVIVSVATSAAGAPVSLAKSAHPVCMRVMWRARTSRCGWPLMVLTLLNRMSPIRLKLLQTTLYKHLHSQTRRRAAAMRARWQPCWVVGRASSGNPRTPRYERA